MFAQKLRSELGINSVISYITLRILFINIFSILYKAATLNIFKLQADLIDVQNIISSTKTELWIRQSFLFMVSALIFLRFLLGFVGLASNVIAVYPILTNDQAELLLPTIITQSIDNVVLNLVEVLLGFGTVKYLQPHNMACFAIFVGRIIFKTSLSILSLNIYSEFYNQLAFGSELREQLVAGESSEEFEIANQNLE